MKISYILMLGVVIGFYSQINLAGSITDSYATGDTLTATKMDTIKSAINDNDSNISANISNIGAKQDRVTGTCPAGESIREIDASGAVICEVDNDTNTTYSAGTGLILNGTAFSVAPAPAKDKFIGHWEFEPYWGGANVCHRGDVSGSYFYEATSVNGNCDAFAPLHLPDGTTITELSCKVYDSHLSGSLDASIVIRGSISPQVAHTNSSVDGITQTLTSGTVAITIDNSINAYSIFINSMNWNAGSNLQVFSCTVSHTGP